MSRLAAQKSSKLTVSVVVPVLNELAAFKPLIDGLLQIQANQIVFVDGGSSDGTWQRLQELTKVEPLVTVTQSSAGRALQMNQGAEVCTGDVILFLHADTQLPLNAHEEITRANNDRKLWGRFDVTFPKGITRAPLMRVIAYFINLRSRLSGIATGDQAIFVNADLFRHIGGFAEIPLMEDIDLSRRLKKHCLPYCSKLKVTTSPRRWLRNGVIKTMVMMWGYRLAFFFGVSPEVLASRYRNVR